MTLKQKENEKGKRADAILYTSNFQSKKLTCGVGVDRGREVWEGEGVGILEEPLMTILKGFVGFNLCIIATWESPSRLGRSLLTPMLLLSITFSLTPSTCPFSTSFSSSFLSFPSSSPLSSSSPSSLLSPSLSTT